MRFPPHEPPRSGAQGLVGYRIDLSDPDGGARITLELHEGHLNRNGTLHGGIQAMLLDAAAGFAASRHLAGNGADIVPVVTLSLTTSFLAPARCGLITARGRVTGGGRKIIYGDAVIADEDGQICSTAQGVFRRAPS